MSSGGPQPIPGRTLEGHDGDVWSAALSPDGLLAVTGSSDMSAIVWDVRARTMLRTLRGHTAMVRCCAISCDGARVATASRDGTVRFWTTGTGTCVSTQRASDSILNSFIDCWMNDDGSVIIAVFRASLRRKAEVVRYHWSADNMVTRSSWKMFLDLFHDVSVAPESNLLAVTRSGQNEYSFQVLVFDLKTFTLLRSSTQEQSLFCGPGISLAAKAPVMVTADGKSLVVLHAFDPEKDVQLSCRCSGDFRGSFVINESGALVAAGTLGKSAIWDVTTKTIIASFVGHRTWPYSWAISSDESTFLIGGDRGCVNVYDVSTLKDKREFLHQVQFVKNWFKSRILVLMPLERAVHELNTIFHELKFIKFADGALTEAIDSVLDEEADVYLTENQFVQVFCKLRRDAKRVLDINKAREEWTVIFNRAAGHRNNSTLRINVTAWRLIKKIHDSSSKSRNKMNKESALKVLRSCVQGNICTISRKEFLTAAEKADIRFAGRGASVGEDAQIECVIDLAVIENGQRVLRLPCMHMFHAECLLPYLEREESPLCPIDRTPVPKDIVPFLPIWTWGTK